MTHYRLPADLPVQPLPFYLAMEEWIAALPAQSDGFAVWQVEPSVIFGRNQLIDHEVDLDYCRQHGIATYRRKSGGGCVFADLSNLMLSHITHTPGPIATIFSRYTALVTSAMRSMGIEAEASGRNDIMVQGRKVSGNAFYRTPTGASIIHSTMLFDTDMAHMARAITPSRSKLAKHGVRSVEARVTMLKHHTQLSISEFAERITNALCSDEYTLTPADISEVEALALPYYEPHWISGRTRRFGRRASRSIAGVGEMQLEVALDADGRIADANLTGDFFPQADIDALVISPLIGQPAARAAEALPAEALEAAVPGLRHRHLAELISDATQA